MAKKKKIDLKLIVAEALDYYHNYVKKTIKESTKRQNESLLSEFYRFVDTLPARDKTMKIFSQKGLNRYKEYLIDKMERSKTDGKKRNFGVGQLNRCGAIIALLINRVLVDKEDGIVRVIWNKVDDPRREDQKGHFPLLENEVTAIENCSGLTPAEEEYRDIFLLQIECGQRVSDLAKILTGKYRVKQGKKFKYIIISTIKENIKARIPLRPKMRMWMEKVNSHKLITPVKFEKIVNGKGNGIYNQAIRRIVKKAGLDREIVRINSLLLEVRGPLYEEITNHAARCTFITNMLKKGVSTEWLSKMTGHASDEMIKRVYAQLTEDDEINLIESDLYSDMEENDLYEDKSQPNSNIIEKPTKAIENNESIQSINECGQSKMAFDPENYVKGLNDAIDDAISKVESISKMGPIISTLVSSSTNPDEILRDIIEVFVSGYDNHMGKQQETQGCLPNIADNEEFRAVNFIMCTTIALYVLLKAYQYVIYNRPYIDDIIDYDENILSLSLKKMPNLNLVFSELQKLPVQKINFMIYKTNCPANVKRELYDFVLSRNVNRFTQTIQTYESAAHNLIVHAYLMDLINNFEKLVPSVTSILDPSFPDQMLLSLNDQIPFLELNEPIGKMFPLFTDTTNLDEFFNTELQIGLLDILIQWIVKLKKNALISERKVYDRILKYINHFPEIAAAYKEYKTKQDATPVVGDVLASKGHKEDKSIAKNQEEAGGKSKHIIIPNFITSHSDNLDIDKLIRLLTEKDELNNNKQFITVLESTNNVNVATCLKHFLGTTSLTPLSFKLKWNGHTKASLKFLIRLLTNTNEKASRSNVIDESDSEGISAEYVSQWTGSGELWAPVCEVFGGSTGYMMSVGLGKEGEKRRRINLEQYNIIADIYFACKK